MLREAESGRMRSTLYFILAQARILLGQTVPSKGIDGLHVPPFVRKRIDSFIRRNTFYAYQAARNKQLFQRAHFLLYDTFMEPVAYVWNIPQEQFAKYFSMQPYAPRTQRLYQCRHFYIPYRMLADRIGGLWKQHFKAM